MSSQEKKSVLTIISSILIIGLYSLYVFNRYHDQILNSPNDFKFWATIVIIFIPVAIVGCIIIFILFSIINKILAKEDLPMMTDERDKLIELKAVRVSHWTFILGFFLSMLSQVIGMQPYVLFLTLVASGFAASIADEITKIYLYRKGV
jgi:hypothetical protein